SRIARDMPLRPAERELDHLYGRQRLDGGRRRGRRLRTEIDVVPAHRVPVEGGPDWRRLVAGPPREPGVQGTLDGRRHASHGPELVRGDLGQGALRTAAAPWKEGWSRVSLGSKPAAGASRTPGGRQDGNHRPALARHF